jgi:hypothetical protein
VRAVQPSDIAVDDEGAIHVADFEKKAIVRSTDGGLTATKFAGAGGTGDQLPHLATYGKLILVTDPTTERIVVFDQEGRQRGVYTFPRKTGGTRPIGIAVTDAGIVYTADRTGYLYRLKINIPEETQAELDALP